MSELAHQDTEIPTQKATRINLQNVVPLPRKSGEITSYTEMNEIQASRLFMSTLRHESRSKLHGDNLAVIIEEYLGKRNDLGNESLQARLSQIVNESNPSDETYDDRLEKDPIFAYITNKLVSKDTKQNSAQQRSAARKMLDLRVTLPSFVNSDDETWLEVTDRLLS